MSKNDPVKGVDEIIRALEVIPRKMQDGAIRAGLTAAAAVIRDEARLRAPKKTGQMAKGIKSGSSRNHPVGTFSISIRPTGPHGFLALFHEYGVAPHFITAGDSGLSPRKLTQKAGREGSTGGALKIGENYVSGGVMHPGVRAHPFMRPALDNKADEAVQAFTVRIRRYIETIGTKTGYNAFAGLDKAA